ncbi:MAG: hypothetical protein AB7G06_06495 [Bdellovibrionales bacterium]
MRSTQSQQGIDIPRKYFYGTMVVLTLGLAGMAGGIWHLHNQMMRDLGELESTMQRTDAMIDDALNGLCADPGHTERPECRGSQQPAPAPTPSGQ